MTYVKRLPSGRLGDVQYDPTTGNVISGSADAAPTDDGPSFWDDLTGFLTAAEAVPASAADPTDNINQTEGGGSTSAADFTNVGGICKPKNLPTLAATRALQNQLNRVAQVKKFGKIVTDGSVGPATLALFRKVQSAAGAGAIMGDPSTCMGIAPDVDVLSAQVKAYADTLGAPATVSGATSLSAPTILTKSGKTVLAPDAAGSISGALATLTGTEKLALLGIGGGVAYLLYTRSKKKRRK